ncbi:ATP-dependent DNA helicase RecG [Patescibacteria group bacterium]|nr:ATP-dependent DNA helicase RecG [Patescibacteria group bacterium]
MSLDTPVSEINFYCKRLSKKLANLGLKTVRDLLFYYPFRYEDLSKIKKINELRAGEPATVKVRVELINNFRSPQKHKKITEALVNDGSGKIQVLWFNQWYLTNIIKPGDELFLIAKLTNNYTKELISPDYEKVSENPTHTGRIIPIYPLTYGLTQKQLRTAIKSALDFVNEIQDYLPQEIISANNLISLKDAVLNIHFPASQESRAQAIERLSFDELFFNQLKNLWLKKDLEKKQAHAAAFHEKETKKFVENLPFKLTNAQRKASWEILKDIELSHPMNRLLNGDVGSGKTLVGALAIYNCALSGLQSVLLAPTEILSYQHYDTFCKLFGNLNIKIGLVTRGQKKMNKELGIRNQAGGKRKKLDSEFITANSDIIIGTHALIQENIKFDKLGLAVIDEQHRFGVEQRAKLTSGEKKYPHLLSMTATPIPRTLALIQYSDLDLSVLDEMPSGRKIIKTYAVSPSKRISSYEFIKKEINSGRQVFVICPLIDASDKLGVKSVTEEYKKLDEKIFPEFNIGMMHGRLKSKEKEEIMQEFKENKINILVSTSVVEVGVDIPNATIMMIEGAERFGLAQLHQFRGRVGRSEHQSYCLLFPTEQPTSRLRAMETTNDGFRLAEMDLELRGPGQIYGKEQSGKIEFRLADMNNMLLIKKAQDAVNNLLADDSELKKSPHLREYLEQKLKNIHLE